MEYPPILNADDRALVSELETVASNRWGDEWAISIRRWSDGTASIYAEHVRGPTEEGHQKIERLLPDGEGNFGHDLIIEERAETVSQDVIEYPVNDGSRDGR